MGIEGAVDDAEEAAEPGDEGGVCEHVSGLCLVGLILEAESG